MRMLISRLVFCGLLLIVVFGGCGKRYTKTQLDNAVDEARSTARIGWISETAHKQKIADAVKVLEAAVKAAKEEARVGWISETAHKQKITAAKEEARVGWISETAHKQKIADAKKVARVGWIAETDHIQKVEDAKEDGIEEGKQAIKADYESMEKQLAAERMIKLAEQIDFFGFDKTNATIPKVVVLKLHEANQQLKEAEQKLSDQPEKSMEHASEVIEIRTKIAYYFLIRYHYRLALQYKERSKTEEKLEAYGIMKQLFENATSNDKSFSLFADISFYCAKIALDYHKEGYYSRAKAIYNELNKSYSSQKKPVQKLIDELKDKVGN